MRFGIRPLTPFPLLAALAFPLNAQDIRTVPLAAVNADVEIAASAVSDGSFRECPVDAITAAYKAASTQNGSQTFSLLAIEQDTLRQCIKRAQLIASLLEASTQLDQQIAAAGLSVQAFVPPTQTQAACPAPESKAEDQAVAVSAPAPATEPAPAFEATLPPVNKPLVSCARGFEVVYTAGAGSRLSALVQRSDEQWHVTKGFELPGGVVVTAIAPGEATITERGEPHKLPAAAASADDDHPARSS